MVVLFILLIAIVAGIAAFRNDKPIELDPQAILRKIAEDDARIEKLKLEIRLQRDEIIRITKGGKMKTLLLVEDSENVIWMYQDALGKYFNVVVAETYEQFLEKIDIHPDIVLTDFNFPGGDGNDVARKSRELKIPLIILQSSDIGGHIDKTLYHAMFAKTDWHEMFRYLKGNLV